MEFKRSRLLHRRTRKTLNTGIRNNQIKILGTPQLLSDDDRDEPPLSLTVLCAVIYMVSGSIQPVLMTLASDAGLADPRCQLYMVAYYVGPACLGATVCCNGGDNHVNDNASSSSLNGISRDSFAKAASIACLDIIAQTINYTGAIMSGPTIFSIIYSSVTVWTAVQSRILLGRRLNILQWLSVLVVFAGLLILKDSATNNGQKILRGAILSFCGSALHALTYVLSEIVMTSGEKLSVRANCFIQGLVACSAFVLWQLMYTRVHFDKLIRAPMIEAQTTNVGAILILFSIAVANLVHSLTFFHTLRHFRGGATSAGLMKGLQAVLIFATTAIIFCGRKGGQEMCFSSNKLASLLIVVLGVSLYGLATTPGQRSITSFKSSSGASVPSEARLV